MPIRLLQDMECSGKTVVIRQDLNVPMKDGRITNDKRIRAALPGIRMALDDFGSGYSSLRMLLQYPSSIIKLDRSLLEAAQDLGASSAGVFRRVIFPLSLPGILSGVTMVFVPAVSTFAISRLLGGGTHMMLGDLIEQQFLGGAYNPHLGSAIALVMMVIVIICMWVMNRFGEGEEQAVVL